MFNAHVGKSVYAMQLRRWFEVFGQENFKVRITFERLQYLFSACVLLYLSRLCY